MNKLVKIEIDNNTINKELKPIYDNTIYIKNSKSDYKTKFYNQILWKYYFQNKIIKKSTLIF